MANTKKTNKTTKKTTAKKVAAPKNKKTAKKNASMPMSISGTPEEISKLKAKAAKAKMPVSRYVFEVLLKK